MKMIQNYKHEQQEDVNYLYHFYRKTTGKYINATSSSQRAAITLCSKQIKIFLTFQFYQFN